MKKKPKATVEKSKEESAEEFSDFKQISERLGNLTEVIDQDLSPAYAFSVIFRQIFWCEPPNYKLDDESYGRTRSSWTYHTAIAIAEASKTLYLDCKFEALGRRDAVIETRDEKPDVILIAEWEWDYSDVFGKGKELDKLQKSCREHKSSDAFLLTYCPETEFVDYVQKIAEFWITSNKRQKFPPTLFLHIVTFEETKRMRNISALKTIEINAAQVIVWNELFF